MPIVDKNYKFEELRESIKDISSQLNLEVPIALPSKKTKSGARKDKGHYAETLSRGEAELISIIYACEIALMGYEY